MSTSRESYRVKETSSPELSPSSMNGDHSDISGGGGGGGGSLMYSPIRKEMMTTPKKQKSQSPSGSSYPVSPAVERLFKVKDSLSTLNSSIRDECESRREHQDSLLFDIRDNVARVEKSLNLETRKRVEGDKVLQTMFDNKMLTMQEIIEKKISDRFSQMQVTIDILTKRVTTLEKQLAEEKEKNMKAVQDLKVALAQTQEDTKATIEAEKVARLEKESLLLKKMGEDSVRISDRIESERSVREQQMQQLHDAVYKLDSERTKMDSDFRQRVVEDMELLHRMIAREQEVRERNENEMANSIDQIVLQIQESLKLVSK